MRRTLATLALLLAAAMPAVAEEIRVLNANALTLVLKPLSETHAKASGNTASFTSGAPGLIQKKLDDGETFDLLIMPNTNLDALEKAGKIVPGSRRPLARVGIGIAINETAGRPDISTPDALKKALLAQKVVVMSDSATGGLSGRNAMEVLKKLSIVDELKGRLQQTGDGQNMIGRGEAGLGLYNVSEIPRAKGVALLGPVPAAVQVYIEYDAAVSATSKSAAATRALLDAFAAPATKPQWTATGIELATK